MNLSKRFNQPFDPYLGLNMDGTPSQDFIDFTNSDDIYGIVKMNSSINTMPNILTKILNFMGLLNPEICFSSLDLSWVTLQELEELIPKYPYLQKLYNHLVKSDLSVGLIADDEKNSKVYGLKDYNINNLRDCWNDTFNYIRLSLTIYYPKGGAHAFQVIIDIQNKKAYVIDSASGASKSMKEKFEFVKELSVEVILREYIDPDITVENFDFESCPAISLQGKSDLCATWSLYLFLLILLNPRYTQRDIYSIFRQYNQSDRDFVILQFLYFLDSLNLQTEIPVFQTNKLFFMTTRKNFNIPSL